MTEKTSLYKGVCDLSTFFRLKPFHIYKIFDKF